MCLDTESSGLIVFSERQYSLLWYELGVHFCKCSFYFLGEPKNAIKRVKNDDWPLNFLFCFSLTGWLLIAVKFVCLAYSSTIRKVSWCHILLKKHLTLAVYVYMFTVFGSKVNTAMHPSMIVCIGALNHWLFFDIETHELVWNIPKTQWLLWSTHLSHGSNFEYNFLAS